MIWLQFDYRNRHNNFCEIQYLLGVFFLVPVKNFVYYWTVMYIRIKFFLGEYKLRIPLKTKSVISLLLLT